MAQERESRFVFLDTHGRRWGRWRVGGLLLGSLMLIGLLVFLRSLWETPQLALPASVHQLQERLKTLQRDESQAFGKATRPLWLQFSKVKTDSYDMPQGREADGAALVPGSEVRLGFTVSWEPKSFRSLRLHADQLTHVCPEWMTLVDGEGTLVVKPDEKVRSLAKEKGLALFPLLNNLVGDDWQPEAVEGLVRGTSERQERFLSSLLGHLQQAEAKGVVVDWGQIDSAYREFVTRLLRRMADTLHSNGMELWLCIPMGLDLAVYDLESLAPGIDRFVAMLHDENSENDSPGPVASQEWFEGWLKTVTEYGDPSQWIIAVGAYGYDWAKGERKAETVAFTDVMTRAESARISSCGLRAPDFNPGFVYQDDGVEHTVWFLDAATFINHVQAARKGGAGGIALSQLGFEDPAVWRVLEEFPKGAITARVSESLRIIKSQDEWAHVGMGEFLTIEDTRSDGLRELRPDATGNLAEQYVRFPSYLTVCHQGRGEKDMAAISFDDGPDPQWTPRILDVLKEKGVKASFFVVGSRAETYPEVVRRIVDEGHEIGVHTYTHPNLALVSRERVLLELNATQRLLEWITGHTTILFRPPFNADSRPADADEILPVQMAQQMGYLTVTADVDPEDWARPGVDALVERVKQGRRAEGNIILLHDGGGDRRQTVEALPRVIDYLQARGDRIVPLSEMLGESTAFVMPPSLPGQYPAARLVSSNGFRLLHFLEELFWTFMMGATGLVVIRTLVVVMLALKEYREQRKVVPQDEPFAPPVSVLLAAYNEEKVIRNTLLALLDTDYPGEIEVIVVDDGSVDDTARIVEELGRDDLRLRLLRQANQGKAMALRKALSCASHEILVSLDADTQFQRDTLQWLVQPLLDPRVGAVSGHAMVGNLDTFIARCQSLEYACGFNLDRRAYHRLNAITVVPGAVSALRRSALIEAGGFSADTLAEDTDLTLSLHRHGYRIAYAPRAVAHTEAPETLSTLARQRLRWAFGTLQCLWKHLDLTFNTRSPALGWFSLPSIWFFQILLVALGPFVDALLLCSVLLGFASELCVFYLLVFLLSDVVLAGLACFLDREPLSKAWLIVPMRFVYRPLLGWVIWKTLFKAIKGAWVSWGKLDRTASVPGRA